MTTGIFTTGTVILPIQIDRDYDGENFYGLALSIRSALTFFFCLIAPIFTNYFEIYNTMTIGSVFMGISCFVFVFGTKVWTILTYIIITSLAEAIIEPKIYEYTIRNAIPGKEGAFISTASMTYSVSVLISGISGGFLLEEYCPDDGRTHCWVMWYWMAFINYIAVFLLFSLKKYLSQPFSQQEADPKIV